MRIDRLRATVLRAVLFVAVGALAAAPSAVERGTAPELPNFGEVEEGIFRGGQPGPGGLEKLREMGVRTIVNLRDDESAAEERARAEPLGFRFVHVAMSVLGAPEDADVRRVLEVLADAAERPVFVHCRRGADRTGVVIGCWRMARSGFGPEEARREADRFGLAWIQLGKKRYLRDRCGAALAGF